MDLFCLRVVVDVPLVVELFDCYSDLLMRHRSGVDLLSHLA